MKLLQKISNYKTLSDYFLTSTLVFIVIIVLFIILGLSDKYTVNPEFIWWLTSIAITFFSVSIASHSAHISNKSDKKMKETQNIEFLKIIEAIENDRAKFLNKTYNLGTLSWKTRTHLEMTKELNKNNLKIEHQNKLVNYFRITIDELNKKNIKLKKLNKSTKQNLTKAYIITKYYNRTKKTNDLITKSIKIFTN